MVLIVIWGKQQYNISGRNPPFILEYTYTIAMQGHCKNKEKRHDRPRIHTAQFGYIGSRIG